MPFSARQGFISSSNVTIDGAFPDFPTLPNRLQYINYLANLSANAATVVEGNVSGTTEPYGQYGGCVFTMPNGNIAMLPGLHGSVNQSTNQTIGLDIATYGILDPSTNTYIFQELARAGASGGNGVVSGAGWVQGITGYQFYRLGGSNVNKVDFANANYSAGNIEGVSQYPTTPYFTYPDPPGVPTITVDGTAATRIVSDTKENGLQLPNGGFLWIPKDASSKLEKWIEGASTTTHAGTYTTSQSQELEGGCLAPNGKVYCAPKRGRDIVVYDYASNTTSTIAITGPDSDSYANNSVQLFMSAAIDNTGNVLLGPHDVDYFGHIDTRTDTFSLRYYGNVIASSYVPFVKHGILGPNGNTYFLPGDAGSGALPGGNGRKLYEISGSSNTATVIVDMDTFVNVATGNPAFVSMTGASYTDNSNIYIPYGRFGSYAGDAFGKTLILNTNANTSIVSGNTHFTYKMSPLGRGTNKGTN